MKKFVIPFIALAFLPAATCEEIPSDAECTIQGTYAVISAPRQKGCQPSGLDQVFTIDEPLVVPCHTDDDFGTVWLPAIEGPSQYAYGTLAAGGCFYDVITARVP